MTPATLRRMEWAGAPITGLDNIPIRTCPYCCASERRGHAPDCELDADIREAERRETGEWPELKAGDWVQSPHPHEDEVHRITTGDMDDWAKATVAEREETFRENVLEIRGERNGRPFLWRKEAPTHD